ncbi:MAG: hypothetical protein IJU26_03150 [Synergistaceae bacterium]|nr:hypothetical protein [Synergistaceae bacterium]
MSALTIKKIQALLETIVWLIAVMVMIVTALPVGMVLMFAGMLLRFVHIEAVSRVADRFMKSLIGFVMFVTRRIRMRTREIEAARAQ